MQLCNALGLSTEQLDELPPSTLPSPLTVNTPSVNGAYQPYDDRARLQQWLLVNTTIYYHVAPSLDLSGIF